MKNMKKNYIFSIIYTLGFLFSLQMAIPAYINSTFISNYLNEELVGLLYSAGSLLAILVLVFVPTILKKIGNYKTTILFTFAFFISFLTMAFVKSIWFIIPAFVLANIILVMVMSFNLDVFLENISDDKKTGGIRGKFLTTSNIAWVISPTIAGLLLTNGDYWKIYSLSAILTIPIFMLLIPSFKNFKDPVYKKTYFWQTFKLIWKDKDIYKIFISALLLRFFYSWMVIYTPIYLHNIIGFEWATIGIMFTIMLLPFILLQIPLGELADRYLGEKEILSLGFIILAISSASLSFILTANFFVWTAVLFTTRVGASMIEIMTESYFFKHVDSGDTNILSFFRMMRPVAYTVAPLIASAILIFTDFRHIFLVLGFIMIFGLRYSLTLKDTK